jgi:hypothetical protein
LGIHDDIRALVIKIKAIIEDETMPEDVGIPSDTRKVERIRQLLKAFFDKYDSEIYH